MSVYVNVNTKDPRKHRAEVDDALKEFKKRMKKSGILNDLRKKEHYVGPSKARRLKREASFKQRKRDEKRSQRKNNL
jgi:small subunit ribosomal protein S21